MKSKIFVEAIVVGIMVVVVGTLVGYLLGKSFSVNLPKMCHEWNKNHIMELSLFLTGFLVHIICELSGVNKWYCKNGSACK